MLAASWDVTDKYLRDDIWVDDAAAVVGWGPGAYTSFDFSST